jgi:kynurenine formamidase
MEVVFVFVDLTSPLDRYPESNALMTHIDLYYNGKEMPSDTLVSQCILLDAINEKSGVITIESVGGIDDVRNHYSVIIRTGWEKYRGTPKYSQCPELDKQMVEALVNKGVCLILVDSPGVRGGARGEEHNKTDKYLADNNAFAVENVVNADKLYKWEFTLYCFPLQMSGQNWAPCRVLAKLDH